MKQLIGRGRSSADDYRGRVLKSRKKKLKPFKKKINGFRKSNKKGK